MKLTVTCCENPFILWSTRICFSMVFLLSHHEPLLADCLSWILLVRRLLCFSTRFRFSRCSLGSLGELQCLSWLIFFSNRVAPASVDSSVHLRLWGKLFIGVTPPNREAKCLVRKGVGLWTIFWAESNPVPDSLSHPIPSQPLDSYHFQMNCQNYLNFPNFLELLIHYLGIWLRWPKFPKLP